MHLPSRRRLGGALLLSALSAAALAAPTLAAPLADAGPVDLATEFEARFDGAAGSNAAGAAVAPAGDVNGDGTDDLIIGAPDADRAYVVFGGAAVSSLGLGALGSDGITISGEGTGGLGVSVAAAGDVNDDGIDDVIVGDADATGVGADSGRAYVIYGSTTPSATVSVGGLLPATTGFRIDGAAAGEDAGISVAGVGDVNDDGIDDVAVGSEQVGSTATTGRVDVVFGTADSATPANVDLASLSGAGITITGAAAGDRAGHAVAGAGDIDGDGVADIALGAPFEDANGVDSGAAYVVFGGASPADLDLGSITTEGIAIVGGAAGDETGTAVAGAGDLNDDDRDDLIVGSPEDSTVNGGSGSAAVIFGSASPAPVDLSSLGAAGALIAGAASGDEAGHRVGGSADINGDGIDDAVVVSRVASNNGSDSGSAHVIYGAAPLGDLDLANPGSRAARVDGAAGSSSRSSGVRSRSPGSRAALRRAR